MTTAQDIIDLARVPLNDEDKDRYTDSDLLRFLNAGLRLLKRSRADFFVGSLATANTDLALDDPLPTPDSVDQAIADYLTARAGTVDNEDTERLGVFFTLAAGQL